MPFSKSEPMNPPRQGTRGKFRAYHALSVESRCSAPERLRNEKRNQGSRIQRHGSVSGDSGARAREGKFPNRRQRPVRALGPRLRCDCAVTSAVRSGVSEHPGIPAALKTQPLRPNWSELNCQPSGSIPVSATIFSYTYEDSNHTLLTPCPYVSRRLAP